MLSIRSIWLFNLHVALHTPLSTRRWLWLLLLVETRETERATADATFSIAINSCLKIIECGGWIRRIKCQRNTLKSSFVVYSSKRTHKHTRHTSHAHRSVESFFGVNILSARQPHTVGSSAERERIRKTRCRKLKHVIDAFAFLLFNLLTKQHRQIRFVHFGLLFPPHTDTHTRCHSIRGMNR